ncbi:MAG: carboxypeptidase regulatory-like domain-containing protein [Acidobacteriia bacterium]|nr:carboxypeptidase regulatory-like domain-containing protein [Terriglobia bacterium]
MSGQRRFIVLLTLVILFTLAVTSLAMADEITARIRGTITDQSGAIIPGAKVTATNTDTALSRDTTSGSDGTYEFLQLPVGNYKVSSEKSGFRTYTATGIKLVINQILVLNIPMEVGQVSQEVSVQANAAQVETTSIQLGTVVTGSTIVDLPLNGRNWVQLQQLQPGVVGSSDRFGSNFATNGSQSQQNSYMINGTDANDIPLNTPLVVPSPDAIGEFRLVTNTLNPEYGRNSGGILNAVTKSGTNQFHGSAFEFFRDTSLNSRNFFAKSAVIFHQNQFGGTIGGPIKKDHTFFFVSYQGTFNRIPQGVGNANVFTNDERNGIFPKLAASNNTSPFPLKGENGTIYPAGTPYSTIFPTGHIPLSDFNSISAKLMNTFVPPPNSGLRSFLFNPITVGHTNQWIARVDHNISAKDNLFVNWFWQTNPNADTLPFTGSNLPGFGEFATRHIQQYTAGWTHIINDHMLNEARFGYTRFNFLAVQPTNPTLPSSFGFQINPNNTSGAGLPVIAVTGLFTLGFSDNGPQPRIDQTYEATDNFTWTVGKHALKFGFDMRRFQVANPFFFLNGGHFDFGGNGSFSTGVPGADFLLGIPDDFSQGSGDFIDARAQQYYTYAQDQWKIRPNLTITYGVGWQIDTPMNDVAHNGNATVAFRPGQQSTLFPTAPKGYVFSGADVNNAAGSTYYGQFGPRAGFAWSPDWGWLSGGPGKLSIRAGYGIYFNRSEEEMTLQFLASPPFGLASTAIGDVGGSPSFANPFCDISGAGCIPNKFPFSAPAAGSKIDFGFFEPLSISTLDPNFRSPYAENYNLTVERELPSSMIFSLAYVGSVAHKLSVETESNPNINVAACAANPTCVKFRSIQNIVFPNHYKFPGDVFGSVGTITSAGNSNYNSLQARLDKHFSNGMQFLASYTWAHSIDNGSGFENSGFGGGRGPGMDPFNFNRNHGDSSFDARQRFVFSYVYAIPSVRKFSAFSRWPSRLTDGWRITGITTFQTGFPFNPTQSGRSSLQCTVFTFYSCPDRPNVAGPAPTLDPRSATFNGLSNYWFNPAAFSAEAIGTIGNAARGVLHGPGVNQFDFALFKDTKITEGTSVEMRFEFFNVFNHTQFGQPSNNFNSPSTFGRIFSAADPRLIQLGLKIYF